LRILGFGTYDSARHPRAGIIIDGLRSKGDEVVEANVPLRVSTAERVAMLGRPWTALGLIPMLLNNWWTIVKRARRASRSGDVDAVFVGYLGHVDVVLARLMFPRTTVVLDHLIFAADTARDRGVEGGLRLRLLGWLDALAIRCADIVVVDTDEHRAMVPDRQRHKAVVVKVGASADWFEAGSRPGAAAGDRESPLSVIFFGLFTPLQGAAVIGEALALLAGRADLAVTMVGSGQDREQVRSVLGADPRVAWSDWIDSTELPEVVARHDVCLGIFGTGPKALRVVPNKVYQGAAAGCALVTSDTPPQRRVLGDTALLVPAGDGAALAAALVRLADDRTEVRNRCGSARRLAAADFGAATIVTPLRERLLRH
jgi:glycosyltransferase involved in cell wall biosynthesis